ncbi:MAG TPA: FAD-dependent thymidylate synthase [Fimbriimonadaceae bacterium]|nr:FAD-dependent thymidylate synthase [Fimbriimonadaceae bacterium]
MIEAKVICDSVTVDGHRLTTVEATYPRFVHAELMTHRVFSRNTASSRAIPLSKTTTRVTHGPAMPVEWGKNQSGMQARELLDEDAAMLARVVWENAAFRAVESANALAELNVHKQIANRVLEPFLSHTAIVSATEWDGFFAQRCHPDAQPEIRELAVAVKKVIQDSRPTVLRRGEWHLPYLRPAEKEELGFEALKVSVARCARVSYLTHDGVRDTAKDLELYERLVTARPMHASPLEHVARPDPSNMQMVPVEDMQGRIAKYVVLPRLGNFLGWQQLRHIIEAAA